MRTVSQAWKYSRLLPTTNAINSNSARWLQRQNPHYSENHVLSEFQHCNSQCWLRFRVLLRGGVYLLTKTLRHVTRSIFHPHNVRRQYSVVHTNKVELAITSTKLTFPLVGKLPIAPDTKELSMKYSLPLAGELLHLRWQVIILLCGPYHITYCIGNRSFF